MILYYIIHLATHSFYFPKIEIKKKDYLYSLILSNHINMIQSNLSLLRSGLIFSGGNRSWQGDTIMLKDIFVLLDQT